MAVNLIEVKEVAGTWVKRPLGEVGKRALNGLIEVGIRTGFLEKFADSVTQRLPQLVQVNGLTPEFTNRFLDLTGRNMVPEVIVGHFNHLDPIVASDFC